MHYISIGHSDVYSSQYHAHLYLTHVPGAQRAKLIALTISGRSFAFSSGPFQSLKTVAKYVTRSVWKSRFQQICPNHTPFLTLSLLRRGASVRRFVPRRRPSVPRRFSARGSFRPEGRSPWRSGVSGTATPGRCGRLGEGPDAAEQTGRCGKRAPWAGRAEPVSLFFHPLFSSPLPWSPADQQSYKLKEAKARKKC